MSFVAYLFTIYLLDVSRLLATSLIVFCCVLHRSCLHFCMVALAAEQLEKQKEKNDSTNAMKMGLFLFHDCTIDSRFWPLTFEREIPLKLENHT